MIVLDVISLKIILNLKDWRNKMRAIFEFDAPDSCVECRLRYSHLRRFGDGEEIKVMKCIVSAGRLTINEYVHERAPFCPLKIVKDENAIFTAEKQYFGNIENVYNN